MTKKLRDYFPMLQTREVILKEINNNEKMWSTFYSWEEERQEEFLDFCTGARGVKVMYDFVSKEILNPESTPERIDELLSLENPYNCPHGRPTIISMSKYELEKKFKRIV